MLKVGVSCIKTQLRTSNHVEVYPMQHSDLMAATAWLMLSFRSCIVCGFDSYTVLFKRPQREYVIRIKSAHDTGTKGQHQPRSCSHKNHYVTSNIPQHGDSTTVD